MKSIAIGIKVLLLILIIQHSATAQYYRPYQPMSSSEVMHALKRLNTLGTALYIAAHPDDENTRLITYLVKKKHIRTGYLSLTRGDGGQNLIGTEKGSLMGVLRTQELLAARNVDGGLQFFTRAIDFGYSKTADETNTIWNREEVLADMVWVIRKLRPDVLITRFPPPEYDYPTHGHHSASAILAEEAFKAAGDPERFTGQLEYVETWSPERLLWNTSTWFYRRTNTELDPANKIKVDVGAYDALLGKSYTEIAGQSRSQHKSQGFGAARRRGSEIEYLEHVMGNRSDEDIFGGINTTWSRVEGGTAIQQLIDRAIESFEPEKPWEITPLLTEAYRKLDQVDNSYWRAVKQHELRNVIAAINGLYFEVLAEDHSAAPGSQASLRAEVVKRSDLEMKLLDIHLPYENTITVDDDLPNNEVMRQEETVQIPVGAAFTHPYWLRDDPLGIGTFSVERQEFIGLPEAQPGLPCEFILEVDGIELKFEIPVQYKWTDPVEGEIYRTFEITPPVTVNIPEKVYVYAGSDPRDIHVVIKAGKKDVNGTVSLDLPPNWQASPEEKQFSLTDKGNEETITFSVTPPGSASVINLEPKVHINGKSYDRSMVLIDYPHIPIQTLFPKATAKLVRLDIKTRGNRIGYVMGAGDEIPSSLRQIGYEVVILRENDLDEQKLKQFDAVILGIRAFNTNPWLRFRQDILMDYVKNGGNVIVQYNTTRGLKVDQIGPHPFRLSHDRVTVEEAPVEIVDKDHPIVNKPNKITAQDFEGWVQERGLYFASEWSDNYQTLFRSNDPGEEPLEGGFLITKYGEGVFIYSGYSWFRQLPAGVPGAFRIFANMISYGQ